MDNSKILENVPLKPYTSMHVGGLARYFAEIRNAEDLLTALEFAKKNTLRLFILGGGSNVIIPDRGFDGLVLWIKLLTKEKVSEDEDSFLYKIGAGESWDEFVAYVVEKNLYGIENLSHIPGSVGASVVQNIGAYGQEVSESVVSVSAVNIETFEQVVLDRAQMGFSYRKSRLNDIQSDKAKYVVTSITFRLKKKGILNTEYNDIKKYFADRPELVLNIQNIRQAIITIRDSKFPFPNSPQNGSVGSFWNADPINEETYEKIIQILKEKGFDKKAEEMINKKSVFKVAQGYKIPYGAFIELLGFKGKKVGGVKILETHAGVINNFSGNATASDVLNLSRQVIDRVYAEFGIKLRIEPEIVS